MLTNLEMAVWCFERAQNRVARGKPFAAAEYMQRSWHYLFLSAGEL